MADEQVSGAAHIHLHALTSPEQELARQAAIGTFWTPNGLDLKDIDLSKSETWGDDRTISASLIRHLAVGDTWPDVHGPSTAGTEALLMAGARISGKLDLRGLTLTRDIWLEKCTFDDLVQLSDSKTKTVSFRGSRLTKGLRAKRAHIEGSLYLNDGFVAEDEVNLEDVIIEKNLECGGGKFYDKARKTNTRALMADNAKIKGDVRLRHEPLADAETTFVACGEVRFVGATVSGDFDCEGGRFRNCGGLALKADGLSCRNLFLHTQFAAEGEVNFIAVRTQRQVACSGGTFSNPGGDALVLRFADIGSVLLFQTKYDGKANRMPASIQGRLDLHQARCRSFRDFKHDDARENVCPQSNVLILDGFTYERFDDCDTAWCARRDWLRRQVSSDPGKSFRPQPWAQAVNVLRNMGYDDDSRRLAIERYRAQIASRSTSRRDRAWLRFLGLTTAYGYSPERALIWALAFFMLGWVTFSCAYEHGYMAPRNGGVVVYLDTNPTAPIPPRYTEFNAFVYSADTILPIIELGQNEAWEPTTRRAPNSPAPPTGSVWTGVVAGLFEFGVHRAIFWIEDIAGWILISLFIAGMSGIIKRE